MGSSQVKIFTFSSIKFAFLAIILMSTSTSVSAQSENQKVVVVPLLGDDNLQYTGNAPISVNQDTNVISFDTTKLNATASSIELSQPSLVVRCLIALQGLFPSRNQDAYLGDIKYVGFNFAQRGWANCDGQLLPIAQNSALFSLLGTIYGGNGSTTFALPDMRGRAPIHVGQGNGLSNRTQGTRYGAERTIPTVNITVSP